MSWSESFTIAVSEEASTAVETRWSAALKKKVNEQRAENNNGVFLILIKVFLANSISLLCSISSILSSDQLFNPFYRPFIKYSDTWSKDNSLKFLDITCKPKGMPILCW